MKQSTFQSPKRTPFHVAIIMDGNGRWATARGLPRVEGHKAGSKTVRRVLEAAPSLGITVLTVYAFSSDNWKRPADEVSQLMRLLYDYLNQEQLNCLKQGIRLNVIGRRDRLSFPLKMAIEAAERVTRHCSILHFRIAVDYSSKESILRAALRLSGSAEPDHHQFSALLGEVTHSIGPSPDVDLVIRTAGEQRLSDYLLWESAYAELYFTKKTWPEFDERDLEEAVCEYNRRVRKFGALPQTIAQ